MTDLLIQQQHTDLKSRALIGFYALTFAITWGVVGIYIIAPEGAVALFGEISGSHPFFFLATWAPALSAFLLILTASGVSGLKAFLSRLLLWRVSPAWAAFLIIGIPLVFMAGSLLKGGPSIAPMPPEGASAMVAVLFMMLFLGPIEEFGWRGVAQPILQRHVAPLWAGVIIGTIWGIWHLPAFFLANTVFASWNFFPFLMGNIAIAVIATPLFNASRGSLLLPMLFHWQLINPFWPDAQPYDTWILVVVAAAIVWWNRDSMLGGKGAMTQVIPADRGANQ